MRRAAALAIALCLPAAAHAGSRWTFCVAAAGDGAEVWISDVFAAEASRERLESAFRTVVERLGATKANAQCPQPRDDPTEAANAQFDAEAFNRRMGANLHAVPASEFPAEAPGGARAHCVRSGAIATLQDDRRSAPTRGRSRPSNRPEASPLPLRERGLGVRGRRESAVMKRARGATLHPALRATFSRKGEGVFSAPSANQSFVNPRDRKLGLAGPFEPVDRTSKRIIYLWQTKRISYRAGINRIGALDEHRRISRRQESVR